MLPLIATLTGTTAAAGPGSGTRVLVWDQSAQLRGSSLTETHHLHPIISAQVRELHLWPPHRWRRSSRMDSGSATLAQIYIFISVAHFSRDAFNKKRFLDPRREVEEVAPVGRPAMESFIDPCEGKSSCSMGGQRSGRLHGGVIKA